MADKTPKSTKPASTTPKTRRSAPGRKPLTLDLDAKSNESRATTSGPNQTAKASNAAPKATPETNKPESSKSNDVKSTAKPVVATPPKPKSSLFGGIIGGAIVAVIGYVALALGLLPFSENTQSLENSGTLITSQELEALENRLSQQITNLQAELQSTQQLNTTLSQFDPDEIQDQLSALEDNVQNISATTITGLADKIAQFETQIATANETGKGNSDLLNALQNQISSGEFGDGPALSQRLAEVTTRFEQFESELKALSVELNQVSKIENTAETENLIAPLDQKISDIASATMSLEQKLASNETSISSLIDETGTLDSSIKNIQTQITQFQDFAENQIGSSKVASAALAATALKTAIDSGKPFASELSFFTSVSQTGETVNNALNQYAQSGVPTLVDLQNRFGPVANMILEASHPPANSVSSKLMSNLQNLVAIRPSGAEEGDTPRAVVGRMTEALNKGSLADVLTEAENLPVPAQDIAEEFLTQVKARQTTDNLILSVLSQTALPN